MASQGQSRSLRSIGEKEVNVAEVLFRLAPCRVLAILMIVAVFLQAVVQYGIMDSRNHQVDLLKQAADADKTATSATEFLQNKQECGQLEVPQIPMFVTSHQAYTSDFMTLWISPFDDDEVYLEFDIAKLQGEGILVDVGVLFANGPTAHFDASLGENSIVNLYLPSDMSGVNVKRYDLSQRTLDANYSEVWEAGQLPQFLTRFPKIGGRKSQDCSTDTTMVVDAKIAINYAFGVTSLDVRVAPHIQYSTVQAHPTNIDLTVYYQSTGEVLRFSIFKLAPTAEMMAPRVADDRVGFFQSSFYILGDYRDEHWFAKRPSQLLDPQVRLINRQRIRQPSGMKNGKPISQLQCAKCKKGIHFYVDPTVPAPFHAATKAGVENFRPAFMPLIAGGKPSYGDWSDVGDEVIYAHAPGDESWPDDYDVADIRFNTISWAPGDGVDIFAIGQSTVDYRSGEVLKANIIFTLGWLQGWLGSDLFYHAFPEGSEGRQALQALDVHKKGPERAEVQQHSSGANVNDLLDGKACVKDTRQLKGPHTQEGLLCRAHYDHGPHLYALSGPSPEDALKFLQEGIADVTGHEVGHTLGLRHNFQGSLHTSFEQAQDTAWVMQEGFSASTMDYIASNYISEKTRREVLGANYDANTRAPVFNPVIGAYDKWAVRYGYTPFESEVVGSGYKRDLGLVDIANEYADLDFNFATDEDADSFDPHSRRFDFCSDPIRWFLEQYNLVKEIQPEIYEKTIVAGEPWENLYRGVNRLVRVAARAAEGLVYFVGGLLVSRRRALGTCVGDDCTGAEKEQPLSAVPQVDQQRALVGIFEFLKAPMDGTLLPKASTNEDLVQRKSSFGPPYDFLGIQPVDLLGLVVANKMSILNQLLAETKLMQLKMNEDLERGDATEPPYLLQALFESCSANILGMTGATPAELKESLRTGTSDPFWADVYLGYLSLVRARATSMNGRIAVAAETEMMRLIHALADVFADSTSTPEQKNFARLAEVKLGVHDPDPA